MYDKNKQKKEAAISALRFVRNNQIIALGSGSTMKYFIRELRKKVKKEKLNVKCIPSSEQIRKGAKKNNLRLIRKSKKIDLAVDGADQIDKDGKLLKGLGAFAFVKEKELDYKANKCVIIADKSKLSKTLNRNVLIKVNKNFKENSLKKLNCRVVKRKGNILFLKCKKITGNLELTLDKVGGVEGNGIFANFKKKPIIVVGKQKEIKLQLALDVLDLKKVFKILDKVKNYIDIIEVGTPLIKKEGEDIVKKVKRKYPNKLVLADLKTMDTGALEAETAFKNKADIITVCGTASDKTIKDAVRIAKKRKKQIVVDLISVKDKLKRARQVSKWKPDYVCVHTGIDEPKQPLSDVRKIAKLGIKFSVAGGINLKTIKKIIKYKPDIIIVGRAITKARNQKIIAEKLKEVINEF